MKVAGIQTDVVFREPEANAENAVAHLERLAKEGVELAVLPECCLTGYCVDTADQAKSLAIARDHPSVKIVQRGAEQHQVSVAVGFAATGRG